MKKTLIAVIGLAIALMAGQALALEVTLIAGGGNTGLDAGDVEVTYDGTSLTVIITVDDTIDDSVVLAETHVHVFADDVGFSDIKVKRGGPSVGKFDYHDDDSEATIDSLVQHTYVIPLDASGEEKVAVHASIEYVHVVGVPDDTLTRPIDDPADIYYDETGWADGEDFPGSNWAMYIDLPWTVSGWDVRDDWTLAVTVIEGPDPGGTYMQLENITQQDFVTGNFSGTGNDSPVPGPYTWNTDGNVTGNIINWIRSGVLPLPHSIFITTFTGTIAEDGSMSGTWFDNLIPTPQAGTWQTISGIATPVALTLP